ncbi:MAG: efflux RND transporter periplasmic adaptor subunit [Acidobacteriota bacterium]
MRSKPLPYIVIIVLVVAAAGFYATKQNFWLAPEAETAADRNDRSARAGMEPRTPQVTKPGGDREVLYWYDPMHPAYRSDEPGIAPDCGMDLVPKYADEAEALAAMPPGTVMLSSQKQQMIGVRTEKVVLASVQRTIRTVGHLTADETKIAHVHTKFEGWIEKVFVDFIGKRVRKGQPLFTVYSPELVSTQEEYLLALEGKQILGESPFERAALGSASLLEAARRRLELWDISAEQIEELERTGKVQRTLTVHPPIQGYVTARKAYENVFVAPGMEIYSIVDLGNIWALAMVYEYELPFIRLGQRATMSLSYLPEKQYRGRVTYIYPLVDPESRTVKVRLEFRNPRMELKPGMYADVEIQVDYGQRIVVPAEAVLDSGMRQIVFLARPNGHFEPREIKVGPRLEDRTIVLAGLEVGEEIVTSGNFLIDSESRLTSATGSMTH